MDSAVATKVIRRLVPFLFVLYVFNFLNRTNLAMASITLTRDLALSQAAYGLGFGLFFYVGYLLFEVPSNMMLARVGASVWIPRIIISWGLASAAMVFVQGERSFYLLRFLLGVAEAGFFPGVILYLSHWLPERSRARGTAATLMAVPVAGVVSGVLGRLLLPLDGLLGLKGWQWLFLIEGLPTVILGVVALFVLPNRPKDASWLSASEADELQRELDAEAAAKTDDGGSLRAVFDARVLMLVLIYFLAVITTYAYIAFLPQTIKELKVTDLQAVLLSALPAALAVAVMIPTARASDKAKDRRFHVAGPLMGAAIAAGAVAFVGAPAAIIALLCITYAGLITGTAVFWSLPPAYFSRRAAPVGVALVSALGSVGGALGPTLLGAFREAGEGAFAMQVVMPALITAAAVLAVLLPKPKHA